MTYLVTGGTGFVGSYVVRLLAEIGERAVVFDLAPDRAALERVLDKHATSEYVIVDGDITDFDLLARTCEEHGVRKVIHTAAVVGSKDSLLTTRVNCNGTINVLEVGRILDLDKVVLTSSIAVFGPSEKYQEEFVPNDAPHFPTSIYGATKSYNEACARIYANQYGLDVIAIRLPHVFGLGRRNKGIGHLIDDELFLKPIALGQPGRVAYGEDSHNWLYVDDAALALVTASQVAKTRTLAFTTGGHVRSTAEVAEYVKKLVPSADITLLPGRFNYPCKFETTPIREELGYQPRWTVEQAIGLIVRSLRGDVS